ncbi:MAG TPA: acyl-CoA dehydrogenase family protein [Candidatus Limnocylindria bacterium]|nr:acyl-CoA dehydrogenase family protein [Candidatus Limnocylindria bacterium]
MNYFLDNPDLVATFDRAVPWDRIVPLTQGKDANVAEAVATWREMLAAAGEYIGTEIAGRAKEVDEIGVIRDGGTVRTSAPMEANLKGLADLGFVGLSLPEAYGGSGVPFTVSSFGVEMIARACPATMVDFGIGYTEPAAMILRFGTEEQKRCYIPRLVSGKIKGAVAMTEPQAGSDVGNVQTAAREEGGSWRLTGRKQFISAGNGDFVIVLARMVAGSKGLDGLGLFIADREGDNYIVERAEHKFPIRGSTTCSLVFEGSKAELLGEPGGGWREITTFMNESRIAIGIQGLGIAEAAFAAASRYASERVQMGKPIREHPMIAEMLLDMETTIAGLRALATEASVLQDEVAFGKDERAGRKLRELTPLVKWYGSEEVIRVCRNTLQIYGGYGVVTEYEVERHMRNALILPIYEGTSQIQSLMAVRDLVRGILRDPASLVRGGPTPTLARVQVGGDYAVARATLVGALRALVAGLARRGGLALVRGKRQPSETEMGPFLLNAERITETLAHLHVARVLGEQARRLPERAGLARRAARRARLVATRNAAAMGAGDGGVFERIESWRNERGTPAR